MFISKDDKEIKWFWYDQKMHTVKMTLDGEALDLKELFESASKLVEDKEEMCKNIMYLGVALSGSSDGGYGFLMGWLLRSMKKDKNWLINHSQEDVPEDEAAEHLASVLEEGARMIREKKGNGVMPKISTPSIGGPDATDLFHN
jgi:hypothetical protein